MFTSTLDVFVSCQNLVLTESRTTGVPKGVEVSHYNIISNSLQVAFKRRMVADTPRAKERRARIDLSGERWLAPLPMFHAYVGNLPSIACRESKVCLVLTDELGSNVLLRNGSADGCQGFYHDEI